ncbi:hypothetical protein NGM37_59915, partial [Streptomyces sp. TRM76130]|nr:hypothetical protein [Streptomyces sp. TRM76130]
MSKNRSSASRMAPTIHGDRPSGPVQPVRQRGSGDAGPGDQDRALQTMRCHARTSFSFVRTKSSDNAATRPETTNP